MRAASPTWPTSCRRPAWTPRWLELELTESAVIRDPVRALSLLQAVKAMGVRLAIDDFGAGYSALGQLRHFPVDTIKIDQSFIRELATSAEDKAITQAIITIGRALGLTIVAEGVETAEQEAFLRANACDQMQGFHLSYPLDAAAFALLMQGDAPAPAHRSRAPWKKPPGPEGRRRLWMPVQQGDQSA